MRSTTNIDREQLMSVRYLFVLVASAACTHSPSASTTPAPPAPAPAPAAPAASFEIAPDSPFAPLHALLGEWSGEDPDHHSSGSFTLGPDLGGKVLVRHNHDDSAQGHHEDLMIVFSSPNGLRAAYFDNEGHTINYGITATGDSIELVSDAVAQQPRFRLRYDVHGADDIAIDFAIAMPGSDEFRHYTGGVVHRVKK
jgi:hypothetical protein